MNKNITVENLVALWDADKTKDHTNFKTQIKTEKYVNYQDKISFAEALFQGACMKDGVIKIDSPLKYCLYVVGMFDLYTNVKIANPDSDIDPGSAANMMWAQFNAINSRGLVEYILALIPAKELEEMNTVIDMVTNDHMANEYEPHAYVSGLLDRITAILSIASESFKDVDLNNVNDLITLVNTKDVNE